MKRSLHHRERIGDFMCGIYRRLERNRVPKMLRLREWIKRMKYIMIDYRMVLLNCCLSMVVILRRSLISHGIQMSHGSSALSRKIISCRSVNLFFLKLMFIFFWKLKYALCRIRKLFLVRLSWTIKCYRCGRWLITSIMKTREKPILKISSDKIPFPIGW